MNNVTTCRRKRTFDELDSFPIQTLLGLYLSWHPRSGVRVEPAPDRAPCLSALDDLLPQPLWTYDAATDDPQRYAGCAAFIPAVRDAASSGDPEAMLYLACLYGTGWGVDRDCFKAVECLRAAAARGSVVARRQMGTCHEYGEGVIMDASKAVSWWRQAAQCGDMVAQSRMGHAALCGDGCRKDDDLARDWFNKAGEQGERYAQHQLGDYFAAFSRRDDEQNAAQAFEWFSRAAAQGCAWSQQRIATAYQCGLGVEKDPQKAANVYLAIAEQGSSFATDALFELGLLHEGELATGECRETAIDFYERAARAGNRDAKLRLARLYEAGNGCVQDHAQAFYWYEKAVEQHPDVEIFRKLGEWLITGTGMTQDLAAAKAWLEKAADMSGSEGLSCFLAEVDELLARINLSAPTGNSQQADNNGRQP